MSGKKGGYLEMEFGLGLFVGFMLGIVITTMLNGEKNDEYWRD